MEEIFYDNLESQIEILGSEIEYFVYSAQNVFIENNKAKIFLNGNEELVVTLTDKFTLNINLKLFDNHKFFKVEDRIVLEMFGKDNSVDLVSLYWGVKKK